MLHVNSLGFEYEEKEVLKDINFSLAPGILLHLRGMNGSGKTTLLKILAGLLHPTTGIILWRNQSIYKNLFNYQRNICYIGHKSGVSQHLTVRENCLLNLKWQGDEQILEKLLVDFHLSAEANTPCSHLSMGQRRRAGLLRLAFSPATIWLLDEPLTALDTFSIELLSHFFKHHLAKGGIIILTSHQALPDSFIQCQVYSL